MKGDPGFTEVITLIQGHRVGPGRAELQTDIGNFVLFAQTEGKGYVCRVLDKWFGHPAGEIVRVVQVSEVRCRVATFGVLIVTDKTVPYHFPLLARRRLAVSAGRGATRAGGGHRLPEGGVDKVRNAATGIAVVV